MTLSRRQRIVRSKGSANPSAPTPTSTFTMAQLGAPDRIYQRASVTGGGAGKGQGTVPVTISSATAGTINARCRSAADGVTILQSEWQAATVAGGATTANIAGVDARAGWFFLDLKGADGAWKPGTVAIGMGRLVAMSGQSLMVNQFSKMHDTATIASTGAAINANSRMLASWNGGTFTNTAATWLPIVESAQGNGAANSAGAAEFLDLMVRTAGVNCGMIGHSVGASAISTWLPGQTNHTELARVLALAGGAFEAFWWFQGHSDAPFADYAGYRANLSTLFTDLAGRSSFAFAKYLTAIPNINSASWGNFYQRTVIRKAMEDWCAANSGISLPMSDVGLVSDIVHQTQAGARRIAQHAHRAMRPAMVPGAASDAGPAITSVSKSGLDLTCAVSLPSGASALASSGSPAGRMLVMAAGDVNGAALALDGVTPITVNASSIVLKLASDPGDVPLEVWPMAVHPVQDGMASGVWDNSNDGDGISLGRQLRFASAPVLRKRTGVLSTAGVSFAAGVFGQGRSAGEMISGGPLMGRTAWEGRVLEARVTLASLPGANQVIASSSGVIGFWINGANITLAWSNSGSVTIAHGMTPGSSYHLRLELDPFNQVRRFYRNGVLINTDTSAEGSYTTTNPFAIGGHGGVPGSFTFTSGVIDEVALWNRTLNSGAGFTPPAAAYAGTEAGLMHLWHCDGNGADSGPVG